VATTELCPFLATATTGEKFIPAKHNDIKLGGKNGDENIEKIGPSLDLLAGGTHSVVACPASGALYRKWQYF
jgi:hypothetical protein